MLCTAPSTHVTLHITLYTHTHIHTHAKLANVAQNSEMAKTPNAKTFIAYVDRIFFRFPDEVIIFRKKLEECIQLTKHYCIIAFNKNAMNS